MCARDYVGSHKYGERIIRFRICVRYMFIYAIHRPHGMCVCVCRFTSVVVYSL